MESGVWGDSIGVGCLSCVSAIFFEWDRREGNWNVEPYLGSSCADCPCPVIVRS